MRMKKVRSNAKKSRGPRRRGRKIFSMVGRTFDGFSARIEEEPDWRAEAPRVPLARAFLWGLVLHVSVVAALIIYEVFKGEEVEDQAKPVSIGPLPGEVRALDLGDIAGGVSEEELRGLPRYRVQPGESLSVIADRNRVSLAELQRVNRITDPNSIKTDDILRIPERLPEGDPEVAEGGLAGAGRVEGDGLEGLPGEVPAPDEAPLQNPIVPAPEPVRLVAEEPGGDVEDARGEVGTYTVVSGDTIYGIARKMGCSPNDLMSLNGISDPTTLQVGATLRIPARR